MLTARRWRGAEVAVRGADLVSGFAGWLRELMSGDGSDLHLKTGSPPKIRQVGGRLIPLERSRIADEDRTAEIHDLIAEGQFYGMATFDQSLVELVKSGEVAMQSALESSSVPHDLQLMLAQAGISVSRED